MSKETQKAKIKSLIALAGLTGTAIEQKFGLYQGQVHETIRGPNARGEKAIAKALGQPAKTLWPDRYDQKTGLRLKPQPTANYNRATADTSRQKLAG